MTKWQMNRVGLLNFWYYDDELFEFEQGKLLLRGTNGSGKSVTMQSLMPVLLDGKKTPERLDSFGSKARKMIDYLLGEEEVTKREERTGYLFIEYKMKDTEQYITTGIGMQARRHKELKSWYFVITDQRRIGIDFELAHRQGNEVIPFSQKELQNRIADGGHVVNQAKEYAELVNKYIFGFETMDAFKELVELLVKLRAPKLSKDFKPTVIYDVLQSALPPLTDDELRHLSDTIENMDQSQQQLEQLMMEFEANQKVVKRYKMYNEYILAERAKRCSEAQFQLKKAVQQQEDEKQQLAEATQTAERLEIEHDQVARDLQVAKREEESLKNHKVWALQKQLAEKTEEQQSNDEQLEKAEKRKEEEEDKRIQMWHKARGWQNELEMKEQEQQVTLQEMSVLANDAYFAAHELNTGSGRYEEEQFNFWEGEVAQYKKQLRQVEQLVFEQDRLDEAHRKIERESSEKAKAIDLLQKDLEQSAHWFDEELHRLNVDFLAWLQRYKPLSFSPEQQQRVSHILHQLYDGAQYEEARAVALAGLHEYRGTLSAQKKENEWQQQRLGQLLAEQQTALEKLKSEEFAEPERMPGTIEFRRKLHEKNIPFTPFYAAVEFHPHVGDKQKSRLEAVLTTTGILDSLISPETFEVDEDALLIPNAGVLGYTLADYLQPDCSDSSISSALIDEILRSIPIDEQDGQFSLDADGFYRIGCLTGHAPQQGASKFIGRTSRKRYQQEQIEAVQQEILNLQQQLVQVQSSWTALDNAYGETMEWQASIPSDKALRDIYDEIVNQRFEQKQLKEQQQRIDQQWLEIRGQVKAVRQKLYALKETTAVAQTKESIAEALQLMDDYLQELNKLRRTMLEFNHLKSRLEDAQQRIAEIDEMIEDQLDEQRLIESKLKLVRAEIESIKQQLQLAGADEIQARIAAVQKQLAHFIQREDQIRSEKPNLFYKRQSIENALERSAREVRFKELMAKQWQLAYEQELQLGFVQIEDTAPAAVEKQLGHALQRDRVKLQEQLSKVMNEEANALAEYHVSSYMKEVEIIPELAELADDRTEGFANLRTRRIVELEYRGQRVSPYTIDRELTSEVEDRRLFLNEQDRELYEEIILNSVGRILKRRIERAEAWVKEMDQLMSKRNNSSGLIFSIAWKPLTAEREEEIDTKELVALLRRESKFLSEDDLQKITQHFRSRIERAKEEVSLRNEGNTLHQVLKEVLDYRKWFSFVLYYTRQNETKKELTNNAFFKFSGGEKAMAMYLPLFTSAYSRYKEADEMAPYIITLDEAFAGVDEQNIRDMFEVVEQLEFNYIMNSQVIWGDYDTVPNLAVAELVRPKNADYVTVLHYTWNGKERVLHE